MSYLHRSTNTPRRPLAIYRILPAEAAFPLSVIANAMADMDGTKGKEGRW